MRDAQQTTIQVSVMRRVTKLILLTISRAQIYGVLHRQISFSSYARSHNQDVRDLLRSAISHCQIKFTLQDFEPAVDTGFTERAQAPTAWAGRLRSCHLRYCCLSIPISLRAEGERYASLR